jgi:hypothetical protein
MRTTEESVLSWDDFNGISPGIGRKDELVIISRTVDI